MIEIDLDELPDDIRGFLRDKARNTGINLSRICAQYAEDGARREMCKVVPLHPAEQTAFSPGD